MELQLQLHQLLMGFDSGEIQNVSVLVEIKELS